MKKVKLVGVFAVVCSLAVSAQQLPDVKLEDLRGNTFTTGIFNKENSGVTLLAFWATWCIPCIHELSAINDNLAGL